MNILVETGKVQEHWTNELPKMDVIYHGPKVKVAERGNHPSLQTYDKGSSLFILSVNKEVRLMWPHRTPFLSLIHSFYPPPPLISLPYIEYSYLIHT